MVSYGEISVNTNFHQICKSNHRLTQTSTRPAPIFVAKSHPTFRMSIENLKTFDPFAGDEDGVQEGLVHIRIQQRNGRKTLTTIQGLSAEYDLKKIVRACKKVRSSWPLLSLALTDERYRASLINFQEFACNGTVVEHPEYGEVLQLQGDQRHKICDWLTKTSLVKSDQLKVHGF